MNIKNHLRWILAATRGFDLGPDHNKCFFLFNQLSVVPDLLETSVREALLCAVALSSYSMSAFISQGRKCVHRPFWTVSGTVHSPAVDRSC